MIGSVHSHMNLEAAEMTDRLLRALECPHLRILGHPTGRMLLHRDPFPFDFERVVAEAVRRGVWLEINASPERLDLSARHGRARPKREGARFTISTDAHHPKHLGNMRYGVITARRGWLAPADIMNTLPADAVRGGPSNTDHENHFFARSLQVQPLPRDRGRGHRPKTGFDIKRSIVRHAGSAVMMAVDDKKRILLVRQFRLPAERYLWELPAGKLDEGEKPLQAARRELIEETGYRARKWKKLASFWPSPGYVEERMTIFLATDLTAGEATPMDDERIEARWFTRKELEEMIRNGKIEDGKTMIGFTPGKSGDVSATPAITFYRAATVRERKVVTNRKS